MFDWVGRTLVVTGLMVTVFHPSLVVGFYGWLAIAAAP